MTTEQFKALKAEIEGEVGDLGWVVATYLPDRWAAAIFFRRTDGAPQALLVHPEDKWDYRGMGWISNHGESQHTGHGSWRRVLVQQVRLISQDDSVCNSYWGELGEDPFAARVMLLELERRFSAHAPPSSQPSPLPPPA